MTYEEQVKNLETLPWQALYNVASAKGIEEIEIKGKDKASIIRTILTNSIVDEKEIEQLVNDYIYGDRVTFTLWTFNSNLCAENYEKLIQLEGITEPFLETTGFRNLKILSVKPYTDLYEILYVYSKEYGYTNEDGHYDSVWEMHRGCVWVGTQANYLASIGKHDKMTREIIIFLSHKLSNPIKQVKPPKAAIEQCINYKALSRIVLQSASGEKTIISKSDGFTDAQQEEVSRLRNGRFDTSGSYIAEISSKTSATVKYNVNKGNIGIYKHLSATELFDWSVNAITIILDEIKKLRGKPAAEIFNELGVELKWSCIPTSQYSMANWFLTEIIASLSDDDERMSQIPVEITPILQEASLFMKIPRVYCHDCDSYEIPLCKNCGNPITIGKSGNLTCSCGSTIKIVCGEGHENLEIRYWYIPTNQFLKEINKNIRKVFKDEDLSYSVCVMDDEMHILRENTLQSEEICFYDVDCFPTITNYSNHLMSYAVRMNEKCGGTCSYPKISKCVSDSSMACLPKAFYTIIPGYRPQPHMNGEYGDISGQIKVNNHSYEMIGIIKKNTKNTGRNTDEKMINETLKTTSKEGQEIIRQFVEQGLADARTQLVAVIAPQYFDSGFKGTLRFLARLGGKKIMFIGLDEICSLLEVNKTIQPI